MITIQEARAEVLRLARGTPEVERVAVADAAGRVLASPVLAEGDLPPFDRVMMDGYAVRGAEAVEGALLAVHASVAAGDEALVPLAAHSAQRIMTGAPLPPGADAVVPQEWTEAGVGQVRLLRGVARGAHVAPRGEDLRAGAEVAGAGDLVGALSLSLLIASGAREVPVARRPRVALLTSGNELVGPGEPVRRGQIRESNGSALAALLRAAGAEVENLGIARDDADELEGRLEHALRSAEIAVLTGGSSVGDYDLSAAVVLSLGGELRFERISVKPGKPTLLFTLPGRRLVFCLPGNPVAALMTGRVLVAAAVAARLGRPVPDWTRCRARLLTPVKRVAERDLLVPMKRTAAGVAFAGWHGSGDLVCLARADAFVFVARGAGEEPAGAEVDVFPISADLALDGAW